MKANSLKLGAIYRNNKTNQLMRLVAHLPCEGVWMETYNGQGYGTTIAFDDVHYATHAEVDKFLNDLREHELKLKMPPLPKVELPTVRIGLPPLPKI